MCGQAASHLLNNWRLDVLRPTLDLHRHVRSDDFADHESTANIDAAITGEGRDGDGLETHLRQHLAYTLLKISWRKLHQSLAKHLANSCVVSLDVTWEPL